MNEIIIQIACLLGIVYLLGSLRYRIKSMKNLVRRWKEQVCYRSCRGKMNCKC